MEIIKEIKEIREKVNHSMMAGYEIVTTEQSIRMLINDQSQCCESWGYFLSEDNTSSFIGAGLINVTVTDMALKTFVIEVHEGAVMFINLETTEGLLQFVAYNVHNGYYGHFAKVECNQLQHSDIL